MMWSMQFAVSPERQGDQTNYIAYGALRKGAEKFISPDILPHLPTAPQNTKNWVKADFLYYADNLESLRDRFTVWLSK